jgi:hypothetical protein
MSTITVAWWWMLVALALIAVTGAVCGWVAYNWGWSHAAEDVHGRHARPDPLAPIAQLALLPAPVVPLGPFTGRSSVLYELPAGAGPYNPFKVDLNIPVELTGRPGQPGKNGGEQDGLTGPVAANLAPVADDPSITTWTREQAEELDRAIKAMIADTDTFIAGLGGG